MVAGTGIKNKLLEALANGLPCVASPLAIRGTSLTDGVDVLVGESAEEVADLIVGLLVDDTLRRRLSSAGRKYVADHHSWSSVAYRFSRVYEELLSDSAPS
jgi:glycosyltransferase involved in cell wall biosynthesis